MHLQIVVPEVARGVVARGVESAAGFGVSRRVGTHLCQTFA